MENVRNRVTIELVKDAERAAKLVNKPNFEELKIFDEFFDRCEDEDNQS